MIPDECAHHGCDILTQHYRLLFGRPIAAILNVLASPGAGEGVLATSATLAAQSLSSDICCPGVSAGVCRHFRQSGHCPVHCPADICRGPIVSACRTSWDTQQQRMDHLGLGSRANNLQQALPNMCSILSCLHAWASLAGCEKTGVPAYRARESTHSSRLWTSWGWASRWRSGRRPGSSR